MNVIFTELVLDEMVIFLRKMEGLVIILQFAVLSQYELKFIILEDSELL